MFLVLQLVDAEVKKEILFKKESSNLNEPEQKRLKKKVGKR